MMKLSLHKILFLCFFTLTSSFSAVAEDTCLSLIKTLVKKDKEIKLVEYPGVKDAKIINKNKSKVAAMLKSIGVPKLEGDSYFDSLNLAYHHIRRTVSDNIKAGDKLSRFAEQLRLLYKHLPDSEQRVLDATSARAVGKLEAFQPSEFLKSESFALHTYSDKLNMSFSDYKKYVQSYLKQTKAYEDVESGPLLSFEEYRDIVAHNLWPIYLKPHDMRHAHWAISHPLGLASIFSTYRSKNNFRYVIMSAMYEGVDRVQYTQETLLAKYMRMEMGFDMEQAVLYLGSSSNDTLEKIAKESGTYEEFMSQADEYKNWTPKKSNLFPAHAKGNVSFEADIDRMVKTFLKYADDPSMESTLKYQIDPHGLPDDFLADELIHKSGGESYKDPIQN